MVYKSNMSPIYIAYNLRQDIKLALQENNGRKPKVFIINNCLHNAYDRVDGAHDRA